MASNDLFELFKVRITDRLVEDGVQTLEQVDAPVMSYPQFATVYALNGGGTWTEEEILDMADSQYRVITSRLTHIMSERNQIYNLKFQKMGNEITIAYQTKVCSFLTMVKRFIF